MRKYGAPRDGQASSNVSPQDKVDHPDSFVWTSLISASGDKYLGDASLYRTAASRNKFIRSIETGG
jgi:hypothetical protein